MRITLGPDRGDRVDVGESFGVANRSMGLGVLAIGHDRELLEAWADDVAALNTAPSTDAHVQRIGGG